MKIRGASRVIQALQGTAPRCLIAKDLTTKELIAKDKDGQLINYKTNYPTQFNLHHKFVFLDKGALDE